MTDISQLVQHAEQLLNRLESLLPAPPSAPAWENASAFRWLHSRGQTGHLQAVVRPHQIRLQDLQGVDEQAARLEQNTRQFVAGRTANNVLLSGARGTGKSSLVKAMLAKFADDGLRLIEVDPQDLLDLPEIIELIRNRPERFIIFCDDLSFEAHDSAYKALKSALDGSLSGMPDNLLVYATSNRRHLMPEFMADNLASQRVNDEIHPGETSEEKISLSERFGLWLSFYPIDQDHYLQICQHWLQELKGPLWTDEIRQEALLWALSRGARSGRVAWQFARDCAGRLSKTADTRLAQL